MNGNDPGPIDQAIASATQFPQDEQPQQGTPQGPPMRPPDQQQQAPPAAPGGAPAAPGAGAAAPAAPRVSPAQAAAQANELHHSAFGRAARFLLGSPVDYQVDAQGRVQQVPIQQKPGQMFRSLLAGAILGGAAGAEGGGQGGFMGAVGRGMSAERGQRQQEDQQRYARAQEQFKTQLEAKKEGREETAAATEEHLKLAQTALVNKEILTQAFTQDVAKHKYGVDLQNELIAAGRPTFAMHEASGSNIPHRDVPASEVQNLPDYHKYQWAPTGTKVSKDSQTGEPYLETTYSAWDPAAQVKLTTDMVKRYKDAGVEMGNLKAGSQISGEAASSFYQDYQAKYNEKNQQLMVDLNVGKMSADVARVRAETAHLLMETAKGKLEENQSKALNGALDELNKNGGDWNKISPKSQTLIYQSNAKMISDLSTAAKAAYAAGDEDEAKKALNQIGQLGNLIPKSFTPQPEKPTKPGDQLSADMAQRYLAAAGGDKEKARQAATADGWSTGQAQTLGQPDPLSKEGREAWQKRRAEEVQQRREILREAPGMILRQAVPNALF